MRTLFALFEQYEDAREAVEVLLQQGFDEEALNAIVQEEVAKGVMDVNWRRANVAVSDEVGEQTLHGLARLIAGQRPVPLAGVGDVFAAGELATLLVKAAASRGAAGALDGGLRAALLDFGLPEDAAAAYAAGVAAGGWLLWLRVPDERAAEAAQVMRECQARHVASNVR